MLNVNLKKKHTHKGFYIAEPTYGNKPHDFITHVHQLILA